MQLPRVAQPDHVVDDVRALPAQLLAEVVTQTTRRLREAHCIHRHARLVATLHDLMSQESILAILDRHTEDVAVLEDRFELEQNVASVRGETSGETHHLLEPALEVLQEFLTKEVLD